LNLRAAGAGARERNQSLDGGFVALEHRFDGTVATIGDPTCDSVPLRQPPCRIAKEDALHEAAHDYPSPDHGSYSHPMDFREILSRRRMVRAYEPEPIPRETLERIVNTVRRAPSAGFSQGQRLLVVTDPAIRQAVADAAGEEFYVEQGFGPWISGAAALVVVCTREDDYHDRYRQPDKVNEAGEEIEWPVPYWHVDAGAAAMLVLLAAIDEGLGAGVFGVPAPNMARVREILNVPDDLAIVEVITLGRPGRDDQSDRLSSRGTRPRRSLDKLVRWERF
jgi:FMN reductase [NAD(P)H]